MYEAKTTRETKAFTFGKQQGPKVGTDAPGPGSYDINHRSTKSTSF